MAVHEGAQKAQGKELAVKWNSAAVALREAKTREADARTKTLELTYAKQVGAVWEEAHLRPYFARVWTGLRIQLLELPEALAERLNPVDPSTASAILDEAIRRVLDATVAQLESYVPAVTQRKPDGKDKRPRKVAQPP